MKCVWISALGLWVALSGCRTMQSSYTQSGTLPANQSVTVRPQDQNFASDDDVRQVVYQESQDEVSPSDISIQEILDSNIPSDEDAELNDNAGRGTLQQLEQTALSMNPAVTEIQAEVDSLRGKLTQAGLPPNPTVGINADDIFEDGTGGRYGVFVGREVVRGNKLGRARSVVLAEIEAAEQRLATVQQRLRSDVRQRYYELLVAQETVATADNLVQISQNAVDVSKKLVDAREAAQTAVLQSELELQNALIVKRQAENRRLAARRKLAGLMGQEDLAQANVEGNVRKILAIADFEQSYDELVNGSPEIAALFAEVEQRRRQLARECVEPIPNVTWQATVQYDTVSDNVISGFQVGMPIPTLNRNQGAIHQARSQIVVAERRAEKKALELRQRLATAYENYLDAKLQVDAYDSEIIPKAEQTLELVTKGYEQGEVGFLQLLTAQRTYSQINLTYLSQLQQVWRQNVEIKGMLLTGSLQ